ncbi:MAG TPA: hypothetical protein V6C99_09520, partial [Oculatellaceae cyanobacterium]
GNNNAYCQDNELSWLDWNISPANQDFYEFVRKVIRIRKENPVFQRRKFFLGAASKSTPIKDVIWYNAKGSEMTEKDWQNPNLLWIGALLNGGAIDEMDEKGNPISGDTFLILLNGSPRPVAFQLPGITPNASWELVLDTTEEQEEGASFKAGDTYRLFGRSLSLLRLKQPA